MYYVVLIWRNKFSSSSPGAICSLFGQTSPILTACILCLPSPVQLFVSPTQPHFLLKVEAMARLVLFSHITPAEFSLPFFKTEKQLTIGLLCELIWRKN